MDAPCLRVPRLHCARRECWSVGGVTGVWVLEGLDSCGVLPCLGALWLGRSLHRSWLKFLSTSMVLSSRGCCEGAVVGSLSLALWFCIRRCPSVDCFSVCPRDGLSSITSNGSSSSKMSTSAHCPRTSKRKENQQHPFLGKTCSANLFLW